MEINPSSMQPSDSYRLLIGSIVPRPIAFVTTASPAGKPNLAPYSFFCAVGSSPFTLLFCPANAKDGREKDTLRNAKPASEGGTGDFVVNVAVEKYARSVAAAGEALPYEESELELVGLTPAPSCRVTAPRLSESPISFECRTRQVIRLNPGAPGGANIVIGDVVWLHVSDDVLDERQRVDPERLGAIGRMGGLSYCSTGHRFDLPLGRDALALADPFT